MKTRYGREIFSEYPKHFVKDLNSQIKNYSTLNLSGNEENITIRLREKKVYQPYIQITLNGIKSLMTLSRISSVPVWIVSVLMYRVYTDCKDIAFVKLTYKIVKEIAEELGIEPPSQPGFSKAVNTLIKEDWLADHINGSGWYWFNAAKIFNGNISKVITG